MSLRFIEIDSRTTTIKDTNKDTMSNYSVLISHHDDLLIWSPENTFFNTKKAEKETYVNIVKSLNDKYGSGYSLSAFGLVRFSMITPTYFNLYIGDTQIGNF